MTKSKKWKVKSLTHENCINPWWKPRTDLNIKITVCFCSALAHVLFNTESDTNFSSQSHRWKASHKICAISEFSMLYTNFKTYYQIFASYPNSQFSIRTLEVISECTNYCVKPENSTLYPIFGLISEFWRYIRIWLFSTVQEADSNNMVFFKN